MASARSKLLKGKKTYRVIEGGVDADGDGTLVDICSLTVSQRLALSESHRDSMGPDGKPVSERAGLAFMAAMATMSLRDPDTGELIFGADEVGELIDQPWFFDLLPRVAAAVSASSDVELARKNC
jgi:hypothetical protein